jgi:hypothetical protein
MPKSKHLAGTDVHPLDLTLDPTLRLAVETLPFTDTLDKGEHPHSDIFDRPIIRCCPHQRNAPALSLPWRNQAHVALFPNALAATKDLSFNSTKVRHLDRIDDILIANNIAQSANGDKTESYNFIWSWHDAVQNIPHNAEEQSSFELIVSSPKSSNPFATFFGICCTDIK